MPKKKSKGTVKKQRGGMTPANPRSNAPSGLAAMNLRRRRGPGGGYGTPGGSTPSLPPGRNRPQDFPGTRTAQGAPAGYAERMAAQQAMHQRYGNALGERLGAGIGTRGRPTGPPRRPPPPIRPGYNVGGPVPETNASLAGKGYQGGGAFMPPSRPRIQDFQGAIAGGPPGRRPTLGPQPRRRRGRGRGGRDV